MTSSLRMSAGSVVREALPFFLITLVWTVLMLVFYGVFLALKPADASYGAAIHASVFVPPFVGFLGQTLRTALRGE